MTRPDIRIEMDCIVKATAATLRHTIRCRCMSDVQMAVKPMSKKRSRRIVVHMHGLIKSFLEVWRHRDSAVTRRRFGGLVRMKPPA